MKYGQLLTLIEIWEYTLYVLIDVDFIILRVRILSVKYRPKKVSIRKSSVVKIKIVLLANSLECFIWGHFWNLTYETFFWVLSPLSDLVLSFFCVFVILGISP